MTTIDDFERLFWMALTMAVLYYVKEWVWYMCEIRPEPQSMLARARVDAIYAEELSDNDLRAAWRIATGECVRRGFWNGDMPTKLPPPQREGHGRTDNDEREETQWDRSCRQRPKRAI